MTPAYAGVQEQQQRVVAARQRRVRAGARGDQRDELLDRHAARVHVDQPLDQRALQRRRAAILPARVALDGRVGRGGVHRREARARRAPRGCATPACANSDSR
jgi:hypothetical protein